MNDSLVLMTRAEVMLRNADTVQKAKELKDLALTAADWAKRKGLGEAAIEHARGYARRSEIRMGELLLATERAKPPNPHPPKERRLRDVTDVAPTLLELGISKRESADAQALASRPKEEREAYIEGKKSRKQIKREKKREQVVKKVATMPTKKYRVLYADPPWKYSDSRDGLDGTTGATAHYPTMSIEELCALSIQDICEPDAVLFLWVTSPLLFECLPVIKAWGFQYKTSFVWDKIKHNMGHYNSVRHEFLLICTRGSCLPDVPKLFDSVQSIERSRKHSEKPNEFRHIIDTLYPYGKRIELFARAASKGWDRYGNEC